MNIITVLLDQVDTSDRLRPVDEDYAQLIAASMAADGQRTPVEVRTAGPDGRYRLIAGAHRHRAAEIAGLATLDAVVLTVTDLHAKRLEIEENLVRHELTELDRAVFLAEWQAVHQGLEGAIRHGGSRTKKQTGKKTRLENGLPARFLEMAADRLRLSEDHIRRAKRRAAIAPDVRRSIAGTWLADHGAELDLLVRLLPEAQRRVVALMRDRGATSIRGIHAEVTQRHVPQNDPDQAQMDALLKVWRRTGQVARGQFREWLKEPESNDA